MEGYTSKHAWLNVEHYLGLTSKSEQPFQGLLDHLSLALCKIVNTLIGDFYNRSQKPWETEDAFAEKLQICILKIIAHKPKILNEANQSLKHQYIHNVRDPYFRVVARG